MQTSVSKSSTSSKPHSLAHKDDQQLRASALQCSASLLQGPRAQFQRRKGALAHCSRRLLGGSSESISRPTVLGVPAHASLVHCGFRCSQHLLSHRASGGCLYSPIVSRWSHAASQRWYLTFRQHLYLPAHNVGRILGPSRCKLRPCDAHLLLSAI